MLNASCAGAAMNVRINLRDLNDATFVRQITQQTGEIAGNTERMTREVLTEVEKALGA